MAYFRARQSPPQGVKRAPVTVSRADTEAAIELLASEQAEDRPQRWAFIHEVIEDINVALFLLFGCLGLLTIWFDWEWGVGLLAGAVVAFFGLALLPKSSLWGATQTLRSAFEGTEFAGLPKTLRARKKGDELGLAAVFLAAAACGTVGTVLLVAGLLGDGKVSLLGVVLLVVASVASAVALGTDVYRDYRYFGLVERARSRLEAELSQAVESGTDAVELTSNQLDVLSQAETKRANRLVRDAVDALPKVLDDSWGVVLAPDVQHYLDHLAGDRPREWRQIVSVIQGLQFEPRPPEARPAGSDEVVIDADSAALSYTLDDDAHRVYVLSILDRGAGDA